MNQPTKELLGKTINARLAVGQVVGAIEANPIYQRELRNGLQSRVEQLQEWYQSLYNLERQIIERLG